MLWLEFCSGTVSWDCFRKIVCFPIVDPLKHIKQVTLTMYSKNMTLVFENNILFTAKATKVKLGQIAVPS